MKTIHKLLLLTIIIFIAACGSSDTATSTSGGDIPLGDLKGKIVLYDSVGKILNDASGAIVQLEGTSFSATTDASGIWSIKDLPSRTYSMSFTKAGCYTMKNTSYHFLGGGISYYGEIHLQQELRFTGTLDGFVFQTATGQGDLYYDFSASAPDSVLIEARIFFSRTPAIDPGDSNSYQTYFTEYAWFASSLHSRNRPLYFSDLSPFFKSGDTIYVKMFFGFDASLDQYLDVTTLKTTVVGFGTPSNTLSTIFP